MTTDIVAVRMWAFNITQSWVRYDGKPARTEDRLRWADELVEWATRPAPEPQPPSPAAPAQAMEVPVAVNG